MSSSWKKGCVLCVTIFIIDNNNFYVIFPKKLNVRYVAQT